MSPHVLFVAGIGALFALAMPSSCLAQQQQLPTTVQLPSFGIAIDAAGVLSIKAFPDPMGRLMRERAAAAKANLPRDVAAPSDLRKISLRRLEAEVAARLREGKPLDEVHRYLAGLQRLTYVFFYPEEKDIVIAGPAEGWMADPSGRVIGIHSGLPVLELEDLVVALRAFPPRRKPGLVGCSIDPNADSLSRLQEFQRTIPRAVRQDQRAETAAKVAQGMEEALGMANVRVFGVPADTHFAHVLIEADYRMKLIGIGREPTPIKLASYLDLATAATARHGMLQRWWFTPNYDCVKLSDDHFAMELEGQGVQLQNEDKVIVAGGQLANAQKANKASEQFTAGFTKRYPELAAHVPIFAQLRNLIDMTVAAAFIQKEDFCSKAAWRMETFGDEAAFKVRGKATPAKAPCVAVSLWKGNRLFTPAGGGVDIQAEKALNSELVKPDRDGQLASTRERLRTMPAERWWWD
jgi:hypothetical protein